MVEMKTAAIKLSSAIVSILVGGPYTLHSWRDRKP